ncbi:MAG: tryptophan--tRNA ligase [Candidatus Omnitrophica bacterium]|nr:tryptophan--tRNA ligase [Candidatus Omnitrophota bacterium]
MAVRVLSGTRATNKLHIGNLFGALENWKKFQSEEAFYMIADWHALTTEYASKMAVKDNVTEIVLDYLACGLNPDICTIFVQSHVHEHAELALMLSMITPLSWLERNPTFKDQIKEQKGKDLHTHGFLGYPVLQAADILLYQADIVPVGEDQLPHLELTREIARRFNHLYGETFKEPQAALTKIKKMPGTDGRKMSKSYNNCIYIADSDNETEKKMKNMVTDPARKRRQDKGHPEVCPVCYYQGIFNTDEVEKLKQQCREAHIGCVDCKKKCIEKVNVFLKPMRERRDYYKTRSAVVNDIVSKGAQQAQRIAAATLTKAKGAIKIL